MSFLGKFFSRRRQVESASSDVVSWPGQSGSGYQYMVYPIDSALPSARGNYIYAEPSEDGQ